jgi:hypothetical protein
MTQNTASKPEPSGELVTRAEPERWVAALKAAPAASPDTASVSDTDGTAAAVTERRPRRAWPRVAAGILVLALAATGSAAAAWQAGGQPRRLRAPARRTLAGTKRSTWRQAAALIAAAVPVAKSGRMARVAGAAEAAARELAGSGDFSRVSWDESTGLWDRQPDQGDAGGMWQPPMWWQSALAVVGLVDYLTAAKDTQPAYQRLLADVYSSNVSRPGSLEPRLFENKYMDDTAWWGLAWADAARYELTVAHDSQAASRYARAAETIASYIYGQPHLCRSGGIDFERGHTPNTLTNAQFIALTAALARLRDTPGPLLDAGKGRAWLADSDTILRWMQSSGLVNMTEGTVRYGYDGSCRPYGAAQTNTEGEMAEALVALGQAAHRPQLVDAAAMFLNRVMSPGLGMLSGAVLQEPCESRREACAGDSYNITVFKGVLDRAVRDWSEATGSVAFEWFLAAQARAVIAHAASNGENATGCHTPRSCVLGMYWARSIRPARQPKLPNAGSQAAGLEALTSALVVGASDPASADAGSPRLVNSSTRPRRAAVG